MRTIEEIKADIEKYTQYEDVPKELRKEYQDVSLQIMQQEESEIYNREQATKGIPLDRLKEICEAELDRRCVVLPFIPQNKTLYWIWGNEIMPALYKGIRGGCVDKNKKYHVTHNMTTKKDRTFINNKKPLTYKAGDKRMFYSDDIGKTVFFTKEAAEQALKGGAE